MVAEAQTKAREEMSIAQVRPWRASPPCLGRRFA